MYWVGSGSIAIMKLLLGNAATMEEDSYGEDIFKVYIIAISQSYDAIDEASIRQSPLESRGCTWEFVPPRASRMAGV